MEIKNAEVKSEILAIDPAKSIEYRTHFDFDKEVVGMLADIMISYDIDSMLNMSFITRQIGSPSRRDVRNGKINPTAHMCEFTRFRPELIFCAKPRIFTSDMYEVELEDIINDDEGLDYPVRARIIETGEVKSFTLNGRHNIDQNTKYDLFILTKQWIETL